MKSNQNALPLKYYCQSNVVRVAKGLLGKLIFTCIEEQVCGGIISETEAYAGIFDRASHAFDGKRTPRNEKMYQQGGVFYVFRCYGVHNMLNVVTNKAEIPDAVLIRGIIPVYNSKIMLKRLDKNQLYSNLTNGPGKVAKALGIELKHNGLYLDSPQIWITKNPSFTKKNYQIQITPRIGIDYAGEDAKLPYRFVLVPKNQQFIQKNDFATINYLFLRFFILNTQKNARFSLSGCNVSQKAVRKLHVSNLCCFSGQKECFFSRTAFK